MTKSNQWRVLYLSRGTEDLYAMIRAALRPGFELVTLDGDSDAERLEKIADVDAVVVAGAKLTRAHIAAAKRLRIVHHQGVGYHDTVDCEALAARGLPLAITPGGTATGVSEHAIMMMLAVMKRLPWLDSEMRQGRFQINSVRHVSYELCGKTVGIIGLGRIGKGVAERLKPFQVRAIYHDILDFPAELERSLGVTRVPFDRLLAESDIVTIHVPRTPSTVDMLDAAAFARMKPTAFLVNTARGGIVSEPALVDALSRGRIAGAALDVFDVEPPAKDHPLYRFPNTVFTPHVSAGTRDAFVTKMNFVFGNLERFFQGIAPEHMVDYVAELGLDRHRPLVGRSRG